ncbi:MAG: outer membrane protein assembly factor BamD [Bacteroidales bacterium]|nr:outer membrane protein assembly factor BamD [Bacteroidales bacterium]
MKRTIRLAITLLTVSILCSCGGYNKLLKSTDNEAKFQAAIDAYNNGSYHRAKDLFENLLLNYHNKEHDEDIAWYYGQTLYHTGDYYTGAYQMKTFTRRFPYSPHAEEAAFMSAYCKYLDSPVHTLDQRITKEAIAEFEQFAERYPQSVHMPEVHQYLDEMHNKLMMKDYENAVLYYKTESYNAAVVALGNFLNDYPESPRREDAMYYIIKAGYEYAINSREDKVKERLQQVINNFDKFATLFSNSKYLAECQNIYDKCKAQIAKTDEAAKQ